jgi:protein-disulfide isomerase
MEREGRRGGAVMRIATARERTIVLIGVATVLVLALGARVAWAWFREPPLLKDWESVAAGGTPMGNERGAVRIVEFTDFLCPHCANEHPRLERALAKYAGQVTLTVRHLPLHTHSYDAAIAAECAAVDGTFREFVAALYARQDSIGTRPWRAYAVDARVRDIPVFERCVTEQGPKARVDSDVQLARSIGADGTPTLLVGGRLIRGVPDDGRLDRLIRAALPPRTSP